MFHEFVIFFFYCSMVMLNINIQGEFMHEYVFKMKKGDIEIELKSDDLEFVEQQLNKWREDIMQKG